MKNRQKSRTIPDFQRDDDVWVKSDEEKGEALFDRYLKQTNQDNEVERRNMLNSLQMDFEGHIPVQLYKEDVQCTIKILKDTAPGPDGLRNSHLKQLSEKEVTILTEAFNNSLESGKIPEDWLDSHLAPVPKPEKDPSKI